MIVIIPIGGSGERFKKNNYKLPKCMINIFGKPILHYLIDSLNLEKINMVCIPYNIEYEKYRFEDTLTHKYPNINFRFLKLEKNTRGAAETLNFMTKFLENKYDTSSVLCLDSDNFYTEDIISLWNGGNSVITIEDFGEEPIYSYINIDNNKIIDIREKEKISNYACTGAYAFDSISTLRKYTEKIITENIRFKDEFYTSVVINEMIKNNIEFNQIKIKKDSWICLGTPTQLRLFYHNYPKINYENKVKIENKRICFDLDNTLVTFPKIKNDYTTVEPIKKNINFLKYLKKFGNTIIIYTARRMKTSNGNLGLVNSSIGKITFETLEKFDIPYDEIYFGKPYADVYIDDLALNCFDDMEKYFGFYMDNIEPRSFNEINSNIIETITKKSNDLSGEIYYYNNIPSEIKDLFPLFIDYDKNNGWYKMEKITGLPVTTLYLSKLLTNENLKHIMNSIKRIQSVNYKGDSNINIYGNYLNKLKERYYNYDYSKFNESNKTYSILHGYLMEYQNKQLGKQTVIHGDTVMTNIIINNFGKIKFIDMRGEIDKKLTITGDWLYDWAKLYQSLIGYDKILLEKELCPIYEKKMINYFEKYFIELYSDNDFKNLKMIANSLLFTLIPLHNNNKCFEYYKLIDVYR